MPAQDFSDAVFVASSDGLGHGDPALTRKVIVTWFKTLIELGAKPQAILFYTAGVKLVTDESHCLHELQQLAQAGVRLIACRTCLDYYELMDCVEVGEIGNMANILEMQAAAGRVITL
jgi:selenium metabolism protein YedF